MAPRRSGTRSADRVARWAASPADPAEAVDPSVDPHAVAREICLRLLAVRARTRCELATALRRRNVPDDAAEVVLDRFTEVGLIDDEAFAAAWVSARHAGRGLAGRALVGELRSRGIAADTVSAAVAALDPQTEMGTARALVERRLPSLRSATPEARIRRLVGMLSRKGYRPGLALQVVRDVVGGPAVMSDDPMSDDPMSDGPMSDDPIEGLPGRR